MNIKGVIYDFDGVMTDNTVIVSESGVESVRCNRSDGLAIAKLRALGVIQVILSTETNPVVVRRAAKLKIPVVHGCDDKKSAVARIVKENYLSPQDVLFVGNDINDLEAMISVGYRACPQDAVEEIKTLPNIFITARKGGEGVIREIYQKLFN